MADYEVFGGKTFQELSEDIYKNTTEKKKELRPIFSKLLGMCTGPAEASLLAPIAHDFMELEIQNDEHLVKLAAIHQRMATANQITQKDSGFMSDAHKNQLYAELLAESEALENEKKQQKTLEQSVDNATTNTK